MSVQRLADLDLGSAGVGKPLKICVASFLGTGGTGGVGTATLALVKHLAASGHKVTQLWTAVHKGKPINVDEPGAGKRTWQYWTKDLEANGIALDFIPHQGDHREWAQKSWLVKEFIAKGDFDVVYFNDWQGAGYYSLLAKRAGMAPFATQLHCVITHSTKQWICESNSEYLQGPSDIEVIGLERKSIEMADVVIAPSRYILREYESYGWRLPEQTFQQPLPIALRPTASAEAQQAAGHTVPIDEIVFFGRLEARKGLWLFCEALDRLGSKLRGKVVTFLGPATHAYGISTATQIVERSARWPFQIRLLTGLDTSQALQYLKTGNRLAVMPSLADNSPCVIYECIASAIPFVSTSGSGIEELIDRSSLPAVLAEPNVKALAEKLDDVLERGATLARPGFDSEENLETWSKWHNYIATNRLRLVKAPKGATGQPVVVGVPLLIFIDNGTCELGQLVQNLVSHRKRFGGGARYILLSSRRGAIKNLLSNLLEGGKSPPIELFDPSEIERARKIILSSRFAFFVDADVEMLTPFFVLALDMLARNPSSLVTCVGAVRYDKNAAPSIERLPVGDIAGVSVFGRSLGGPVWGVSPATINELLKKLELYDRQADRFVSSSALGDIFTHRCRVANVPIELIPVVGAVIHRESLESQPETRTEDPRAYCRAMGLNPSLASGGPAWFAMATFGPNPWEILPTTDGLFPLPAPTRAVSQSELAEPSLLAAALGRPELAFQLEGSAGASPERLQTLNRVAVEVARQSSVVDLLGVLAEGRGTEFGPDGFRGITWQTPKETSDTIAESTKLDSVVVYVDARLRLELRKIRANASLRSGGPARLVFFDVSLSGQSSLNIAVRSRSLDPLFFRAIAIDQGSGQEIGEKSVRLTRSAPADLSINLYKIYGPAAVVMEFSGVDKMEVLFDALAAV